MRVLVCGSRSIDSDPAVTNAIRESPWEPDIIVHGAAGGVDTCAGQYALENDIEVETHPIHEWMWEKVGSKAGPMRNSYMVDESEAVIAVWDGDSNGTQNTIKQAEGEGLPVFIAYCDQKGDVWYVDDYEYRENDQSTLQEFEQ